MATDSAQISIEDRIKSLLQDEALVLYWKCKRYGHKQIAQKVQWGEDWVQLRMVRIYKKLGFKTEMHWTRRVRILKQEVCPIYNELLKNDLRNIPKIFAAEVEFIEDIEVIEEENQQISVVRVHQDEKIADGPLTEEEQITLDLVLYDQMKEEEDDSDSAERTEYNAPLIKIPTRKEDGRSIWWWISRIGIVGGLCLCVGTGVWLLSRFPLGANIPLQGIFTPQQLAESTNPPQPTSNIGATRAPTDTVQPTFTFTPETLPTAMPFPGMETFSKPWSNLWIVSGDPYLASGATYGYDGVLTAKVGDIVSFSIGNGAWTDYVINLGFTPYLTFNTEVTIGVRVQDLNNMVALRCVSVTCEWIVIDMGQVNILVAYENIDMAAGGTVSVEGSTFIADSTYRQQGSNLGPASFTLPAKYQDKFKQGGVYIRFKDTEFNFLEIQPLP